MDIELTAEQRNAMKCLKDALTLMYNCGFGSDGIKFVLEEKFPIICNEMAGGESDRHWHRNTDPYYRMSPGDAAAYRIVPGTE
jgi:hypothetical protein